MRKKEKQNRQLLGHNVPGPIVVAMNSTNLCMLCMSAIMLRIDGDSVACATAHCKNECVILTCV